MMNAASDDDIYSIEKLLPPPAKPPKAKKVVHHSESCPPTDRSSNSRQNSRVDHTNRFPAHQRSQSATHGKVSKHHAAAVRAQSNPVRTSSTSKGFVNPDSRGRTSQSVSSFIDRDSFCTVTFNRCSSEIEMQGLESATSSSLAHGTVLISIMLTSLAAFVCSKLKDPCEDFFLAPNYKCDQIFSVLFSIFNIFSCLYAFTIYFLHLIGQCDYLSWSARRKVSLEILCTIMMVFALFACEVLLVTRTMALRRPINSYAITSVIFTFISIILYGLRTFLLIREIRMLWAHPSQINPRTGSQMSKDASLQGSFQQRESKSMRVSETDSLHSSNPSQSITHQPSKISRDGSTKKSVTYARDNGMSSIEMDDVFTDGS